MTRADVDRPTWPTSGEHHGDLGDGRYASRRERADSVERVRAIVGSAAADGLAVYPQGGRESLDYGGPPDRPGVALDLTGLNRIIEYPVDDLTITVEAGRSIASLQDTLAEHGQHLAIDVRPGARGTVGGVFATQFAGPRRHGWGRPRDQIIGVQFVTADGRVIKGGGKVVKNAAGYDFPRLLTGSMGTLGIITAVSLKVRPQPETTSLAWVPTGTASRAGEMLDSLARIRVRPVAVELLSRRAALAAAGSSGLDLEVGHDWTLVVGFEGNAMSVAWQTSRLSEELGVEPRIVDEGQGRARALWQALLETTEAPAGEIGFVANVRPSAVAALVSRLDPEEWNVQAHAGHGIVRAHRSLGVDPGSLAHSIRELRVAAVADGGNLMLHPAPVEWKRRLGVWGEPREDWAMMERIRRVFDPEGLLNPGRFRFTMRQD